MPMQIEQMEIRQYVIRDSEFQMCENPMLYPVSDIPHFSNFSLENFPKMFENYPKGNRVRFVTHEKLSRNAWK